MGSEIAQVHVLQRRDIRENSASRLPRDAMRGTVPGPDVPDSVISFRLWVCPVPSLPSQSVAAILASEPYYTPQALWAKTNSDTMRDMLSVSPLDRCKA